MSLGMTIETVGYLVLAVIAIVILYIVLQSFAPKIPDFISQSFDKFKTWLCGKIYIPIACPLIPGV